MQTVEVSDYTFEILEKKAEELNTYVSEIIDELVDEHINEVH